MTNARAIQPRRTRPADLPKRNSAGEKAATDAQTSAASAQTIRLGLQAAEASAVFVAGSFNAWSVDDTALASDGAGSWSIEVSLPPGEHEYRFIVDGQWRDDPNAVRQAPNPFGGLNSVIEVRAEPPNDGMRPDGE